MIHVFGLVTVVIVAGSEFPESGNGTGVWDLLGLGDSGEDRIYLG